MNRPPPPRTVLVTGASRRLGRAIALALAASGWHVAVHFRGSEQEARETAAECARHAPGRGVSRPTWQDEAQVRALVPAVGWAGSGSWMRW